MQIKSFKLINDGYDGIKVIYLEPIKIKKATHSIDSIDRTRNYPVSVALKGKIAGLTYFFLNLTRHWVAPFNKYFNLTTYDLTPVDPNSEMASGEGILRNLWNDTTITGASINNGDIIITGKINVFGDKEMGMATSSVSVEDDFGFYDELKNRLDEIADMITELISQKQIESSTETLMISQNVEGAEKMTPDELADVMLERLSKKGVVIMQQDDDSPAAIGDGSEDNDSVKNNNNPIDSDNIPEAESVDPGNKTDPKEVGSTLASESDFPDLGDKEGPAQGSALPKGEGNMADYEHSENMGSESEPGPEEAKDAEEPWVE